MTASDGEAPAKRDFLSLRDLDRGALDRVLRRATRLKSGEEGGRPLAGKTLAMIFRKSSTRTRVSFETGIFQLGGHAVFLSDRDSQMGRGESAEDTARVLSGYVDAIMVRTFAHAEVETLARHATVPVINGLTDLLHPCQLLADLQTIVEEFGEELADVPVAWIGDGNNVLHSWIHAAALVGFPLRVAVPEGYDPDPDLLAWGREHGDVELVRDPRVAVEGARVVTTDTWASMGQEDEATDREAAFAGFRVDEELMSRAVDDAIFLHCLPAYRGKEVTAAVIDGPRSRIFSEAENRLHAQKSLLIELMG
ncbi:MAG: ornithine carbamoyltransferase [Longimicrobiales bacterium]|nr:ornithine carbamoyltransferase [Longimicrobiales bacterium]